MRLLDWVKKWIFAVRNYHKLQNNFLDLATAATKTCTHNAELFRENCELKEQLRQCQMVFHTHRHAAMHSINEANKAEAEYKRKLLGE
jgi:hypothetical protein